MKTFLKQTKWAFFAGALALAVPATAGAAMTESGERWAQGEAELQKHLPPGQPADVYRNRFADLTPIAHVSIEVNHCADCNEPVAH